MDHLSGSFLLFVFANNLEEGTCSKLLHSHKPIITLECLHYLPVKSVTRNFIITTTVLDPFILIIYLYTDICFKKTGSFLSFQWKKKKQPKKSNFKISALNHEVALNQVLHLECVDKKEIRGKFCTCFWWIYYMLNTWVLQSFLNLIKDIQLITDVKRSLHTKWHLPKFGHVEKWNFFLQ